MKIFGPFSDIFWHKNVWLPPNFTWDQLEPKYEYQFTNYRHLYSYAIPLACVILFIRLLLERYCFWPLGLKLGIKNNKPKKIQNNVTLENAYKYDSKWKHKDILGLAKRIDWSERQVSRWLRIRKLQGKPSKLVKFCENSWRCVYYTSSFVYGLVILWNKPWFWNMDHCWLNYPYQGVTRDVWWYYMISLAFYWSLAFSQFFDVKRKDFWQMFIHHIATIVLLSFSWICNLHRVGTLVLVIHDAADCILDGTKAVNYAKYNKLSSVLFVVFTLTWIITRVIIFPFWILKSTTMEAPYVAKMMFPAYYIFNGLLILLLILHIFWTVLIFQLAYRTWTAGQLEGDIRSSASSEDSDDSGKSSVHNNYTVEKNNDLKSENNSSYSLKNR
ncbi:hypothetical protein PGB90_000183 [Kerria lacca]